MRVFAARVPYLLQQSPVLKYYYLTVSSEIQGFALCYVYEVV